MYRAGLVVIVMLIATGCTSSLGDNEEREPASPPVSWEYKQDIVCAATQLPLPEHEAKIGSLVGHREREGWELVSSSPSTSESETCYTLFFRRQTI
jgi:hypothetical protein